MRVGAHAPIPFRGQCHELRDQLAGIVEKLLRPIALHPLFKQRDVGGFARHLGKGHLMRAPKILSFFAVDLLGSCPALGCTQDDHGPARALADACFTGLILDALDFANGPLERLRHCLMHGLGLGALDEIGFVPIANEQAFQLCLAYARKQCRIRDLVAI